MGHLRISKTSHQERRRMIISILRMLATSPFNLHLLATRWYRKTRSLTRSKRWTTARTIFNFTMQKNTLTETLGFVVLQVTLFSYRYLPLDLAWRDYSRLLQVLISLYEATWQFYSSSEYLPVIPASIVDRPQRSRSSTSLGKLQETTHPFWQSQARS